MIRPRWQQAKQVFQTSLSLAAFYTSSCGILRWSQANWDHLRKELSKTGGILIKCPTHLSSLNMEEQRVYTQSDSTLIKMDV